MTSSMRLQSNRPKEEPINLREKFDLLYRSRYLNTYNPNAFILWNGNTDKNVLLSSNVDRFTHTLPVLGRAYSSAAGHVGAVAECQQG